MKLNIRLKLDFLTDYNIKVPVFFNKKQFLFSVYFNKKHFFIIRFLCSIKKTVLFQCFSIKKNIAFYLLIMFQ